MFGDTSGPDRLNGSAFFCIIIQYNMMHSDVKISGTNSGIYNILIAVSVFLVFLYVPLVQTVIDGKVVESFTVAENNR